MRDGISLNTAKKRIKLLGESIKKSSDSDISLIKIKGLLNIADSIVTSALARKESRGTHQRSDFPLQSELYLGNHYINNSEIKFKDKKCKLKKTI